MHSAVIGHRSGPRRLLGFLFGRLSHLTLHLGVFSSQVRHDAQHPFHEHQLTAAMHLVLLGAHQGFEPGLGRLAPSINLCPGRHCGPVAARTLSQILGPPIQVDRRRRGRPATAVEIRRLIERMVSANPLWRAPRIHGELKMLGIAISERTVSRILRRLRRPPSQTWKTFLHNHLGQMVSIDFFTVPTITMKVLFVFIVLEHRRRQVLHFNVTEHPTAAWTSQQIVEAFADRDVPRYLIRDRDGVYGNEVRLRIASLHMEEVLTAPQSPWQNPYAERLIGSIRRDCLNHFVILNARHLKKPSLRISLTTTDRGPIWASTSNVHFLGKSRVSERSSRSRNSAVCITDMNALQLNDISADAFLANECDQRRLACSVGVSPTGVRVRSPVAWVAFVEETKRMKPTDKAILGMVSESPGRNASEPRGGLDKINPEGRAL